MKKLTALALAGCMAVSLAACGGSASTTPASSEAATQEEAVPAEQDAPQLPRAQLRALPRPLRAVRSASASTSSTMPS